MKRFVRVLLACAGIALLAACSSGSPKLRPAELGPDPQKLAVQPLWSVRLGGEVAAQLQARAGGSVLALASTEGTVLALDADKGGELWRAAVGAPLSAGVGFDGRWAAVVTRDNELVVLEAGRVLWRQRQPAQVHTAPLVAGARVFVLAADRSVAAFDAQSGRRLWNQQRTGEALVLRQPGVLLPVGDTLVAGLSGRLVGLHPLTGGVRWEAPLATPRGTNDIERLVDLVAPVSREADVICARAFQAAVGCVDAGRGAVLWTRPANGHRGVQGDAGHIYGVEADGTVLAWRRTDGERAWSQDGLRYRGLGAPLLFDTTLMLGDEAGLLHFVSARDGSLLARVATDGTALAGAPLRVGQAVVTVTRGGSVQAWRVAP